MKVHGKFRVYPLWREDVFKDIARIAEPDRGGIREGSICTVSVNDHTKHLIVRGLLDALPGGIMLDEITRKAMGDLQEGITYDFQIKRSRIWGHINGHVQLLIGDLAFRHGLESSRYSSDFLERC